MDTRHIESMIADLCAEADSEPDLYDLVSVVTSNEGRECSEDAIRKGVRFVCGYIEQVPYMMKVAWIAATTVGLENEMRRILDMVNSYWIEGDDVIPDELGVIGLLDDAYCSMTSLQAVSDHYRLQTGKHLFPDDLTAANAAMRKIIGEPYASELDRIVIKTMTETGLIQAVQAMAHEDKRMLFKSNSTIWNHGPAGEVELGDLEHLGLLDVSPNR